MAEGVLPGKLALRSRMAALLAVLGLLLWFRLHWKPAPAVGAAGTLGGAEEPLIGDLLAAVKLRPSDGQLYWVLTRAYAREGYLLEAVETAEAARSFGAESAGLREHLGSIYLRLGWGEEAIAAYKAALRLDENRLETYLGLNTALRSIGRSQDSLEVLGRIPPRLRREPANLEKIAIGYAFSGRFETALSLCREVLSAVPDRSPAYAISGKCYLALGRVKEAIAALRRACELEPGDTDSRYTLGLTLVQQGGKEHDQEALTHLKKVLERNREQVAARFWMGRALLAQRRWREAAYAFAQTYTAGFLPVPSLLGAAAAYGKAGDPASAAYAKGRFFEQTRQYDSALREFRRLAKFPRWQVQAYSHLASVYQHQGRPQQAIDVWQETLRRAPKSAVLHRQLAAAYAVLQYTNEQVRSLKKTIALAPQNADVDYRELSDLALASGKYDEAEQYLGRCIRLKPAKATYRYLLARVYLFRSSQGDRLGQAVALLEEARHLEPGLSSVHEMLGDAYRKAGRLEEAAQALQRALALHPERLPLLFQLGQLYERLGKQESARRLLARYSRVRKLETERDLLERDARARPADTTVHARLGELYFSLKRYGNALREFRELAALAPGSPRAHERLAAVYGEMAHPQEQWRHLQLAEQLSLR